MVRTLDSSLLTALNNTTRKPAIALQVQDQVTHYALYQSPGTADALNDACIANNNAIVRVQVTRNSFTSNVQYQVVSDPTNAAQWTSWTTLPGGSNSIFQDGGCAISNSSGTLRIFAQRGTGGNNLYCWSSANNGSTWTGPTTVLSPPGGALLKGIASAGNNDVFFLYDVSGGEAIGCSFYVGGTWNPLTIWTLATLQGSGGLAVTYVSSQYTIVYSNGYSLATCTYTPLTKQWKSGVVIAAATSTAIGRVSPHLTWANGVYTLVCIEFDSGLLTGAVYSYPRLRQSLDLVHWSGGTIVHDLPSSYGVVLLSLPTPASGNAGARNYLVSLASVYSARQFQTGDASQTLDLSNAILSYQRIEQVGKPTQLEVLIDNAQGVLNNALSSTTAYQPLGLNASLLLSEGYVTATSPINNDTIRVSTSRIEQIQIVRSPLENHIVLIGTDLSETLDLPARYQNVYANQTVGYLITEMCACAGILNITLPTTSQINQVVPSFVLSAGSTYRHALDELCNTYGLAYFLDQNESMQFRELSANDASIWSYQPEIETVSFGTNEHRANHIVVTGKPPLTGLNGALTTAEAYDDTHMHLVGVERLLHHVDPKLTTVAQCSQKASLLMAQEARAGVKYTVSVPLNPALQVLDCISLTDRSAPQGSSQQVVGRIIRIVIEYSAQEGKYEMQLALEGL